MAHGFVYSHYLKDGEIYSFKNQWDFPRGGYPAFKPAYDFVWDIYNEVARANGIHLPKHWACVEEMQARDIYRRRRPKWFILEPLGPVTHVDYNYSLTNYLSPGMGKNVAYAYNWYNLAEKFFMVRYSAKTTLSATYRIRPGLLCKKWRGISLAARQHLIDK